MVFVKVIVSRKKKIKSICLNKNVLAIYMKHDKICNTPKKGILSIFPLSEAQKSLKEEREDGLNKVK